MAIAALLIACGPIAESFAQVVTPTLTPSPCAGAHCLNPQRGATTMHYRGPSAEKFNCPEGTIFDARKHTCRVLLLK